MPLLARPDGAQLHWEEAGEGPGVLISNTFNLAPVDELVERLASSSRRVLIYEPRGLGRSSHDGPYDLETGLRDVEALLEETGSVDVVFGIGDGTHRALRIADSRPDLVDRVVFTSSALGRESGERSGFASSTSVLYALMSLIRRDYRSGLRQMLSGSAHNEAEERQRLEELVAEIPQDAAIGYLEAWIAAESFDVARRLGNRLTALAYPGNDWFPIEMYEGMRDHLTEACFEFVDDGPMSRPDLAAQVLLRVSEPAKG